LRLPCLPRAHCCCHCHSASAWHCSTGGSRHRTVRLAALSSAAVFCETSAEGVRGRLCSPVGERLLYAYLHLALHLQYWRRRVRRGPGQYQHWVVLATSPAQCYDDHTCSYASFVVLPLPVWRWQQQQQQQCLSKYFWKHAHSKSAVEVELTRKGIAPPTIRGLGRADVVWA